MTDATVERQRTALEEIVELESLGRSENWRMVTAIAREALNQPTEAKHE